MGGSTRGLPRREARLNVDPLHPSQVVEIDKKEVAEQQLGDTSPMLKDSSTRSPARRLSIYWLFWKTESESRHELVDCGNATPKAAIGPDASPRLTRFIGGAGPVSRATLPCRDISKARYSSV